MFKTKTRDFLHEEKLELVAVGGISFRAGWLPQLRLFHSVCVYPGFSLGELLIVRHRRSSSRRRSRARFGKPKLYRGKVFGTILTGLSLLVFAFFSYIFFYELKQLPASAEAPRVGQKAPEFTLPDQNAKPVALADLILSQAGKPGGAVLIFYRGFW